MNGYDWFGRGCVYEMCVNEGKVGKAGHDQIQTKNLTHVCTPTAKQNRVII